MRTLRPDSIRSCISRTLPKDGSADAAGKPYWIAFAVSNRRETMQCSFDAGAIVVAEASESRNYRLDVVARDLLVR